MAEVAVVAADCPLEWKLSAQVKVQNGGALPDAWPTRVRVLVSEREDFGGAPAEAFARVNNKTGESPADLVLKGPHDKTVWLRAEGVSEPWKSEAKKVDLKQKDVKTEILTLAPEGGSLIVELKQADGTPPARQVTFKLEGPEAKDAQVTVAGVKQFRPLKPGDYTLTVADVPALIAGGWKLGPSADGVFKVKLTAGKVTRLTLNLTKYLKAQFVAFDIKPGTREDPATKKQFYLGDPDEFEDMGRRVQVMRSAMQIALTKATADADTLKIFMAPEFYWRGKSGAYDVQDLGDIMEALRPEAEKVAYTDWIFVYGTAIGYFKHSEWVGHTHELAINDVLDVKQGTTSVTVGENPDLRRRNAVSAAICGRIPDEAAVPIRWRLKQGANVAGVKRATRMGRVWALELDKKVAVTKGPCLLMEPVATEVFNIALVQRGGPARAGAGLNEALVYKEFISHIDFITVPSAGGFYAPDGSGREIEIHGDGNRLVLPTEGAKDLLGGQSSALTELNKSGLGGGSVFTMAGITFGLEVCRDHCQNRLFNHYKTPRKGEPLPQIALIPAWGMTIDLGPTVTVPKGLVFNVDGPTGSFAGTMKDARFRCPYHPNAFFTAPGTCAAPGGCYWQCPEPHCHQQTAGPDCPHCRSPMLDRTVHYCTAPYHYVLAAAPQCTCGNKTPTLGILCTTCNDFSPPGNCPTCGPAAVKINVKQCDKPHLQMVGGHCADPFCAGVVQALPSFMCRNHQQRADKKGKCPKCTKDMVAYASPYIQEWTPAVAGGAADVPDVNEDVTVCKVTRRLQSKQAELFETTGKVRAFPALPIPEAEIVK